LQRPPLKESTLHELMANPSLQHCSSARSLDASSPLGNERLPKRPSIGDLALRQERSMVLWPSSIRLLPPNREPASEWPSPLPRRTAPFPHLASLLGQRIK